MGNNSVLGWFHKAFSSFLTVLWIISLFASAFIHLKRVYNWHSVSYWFLQVQAVLLLLGGFPISGVLSHNHTVLLQLCAFLGSSELVLLFYVKLHRVLVISLEGQIILKGPLLWIGSSRRKNIVILVRKRVTMFEEKLHSGITTFHKSFAA